MYTAFRPVRCSTTSNQFVLIRYQAVLDYCCLILAISHFISSTRGILTGCCYAKYSKVIIIMASPNNVSTLTKQCQDNQTVCIDLDDLRKELAENAGVMVVVTIVIIVWLMVFLVALKNMDKPPKNKTDDEDEKNTKPEAVNV
ncbi:hypothetical protein AC249_AIPGENE16746 [Exaiptasia diaphana]|nr:hypothetical protein AC249_AIPGENE16746 [Exaiptasia diaphana]